MSKCSCVILAACVALLPGYALAAGPVAYPSKGQSAQQQQKDEGECYAWAKRRTGIDPTALASAPPPQAGTAFGGGERMRGAFRGAFGGAAIGAIAGDAGKGAAAGAIAGGMLGGREARLHQQARSQQASQYQRSQLQTFNNAWTACMEGRGYSVR